MTESPDKIVLGIDPGTTVMGYGVIGLYKKRPKLIQYGVIHLHKYNDHALKLQKIFDRILAIIEEFKPDEVALEAPFYGKNVQSMLKLGRAQGVAIAAALSREIPIQEYSPKKVKQSVTGNGNASKEQVAAMLMNMLGIKEAPKLLDASDALGVALCHIHMGGQETSKPKSWKSFLRENPDRSS